ncbi:hypothetical protein ACN38_g1083 [Penicillium nordicum]|uniref:Uncharacterized protein n=1 Tax=Penicillium nordicum TaxID=229535 RepID=A0A0M8PHR0_9EURO|nr:hypothetical protein ACN38_g1083 [Penicillium nordicum]
MDVQISKNKIKFQSPISTKLSFIGTWKLVSADQFPTTGKSSLSFHQNHGRQHPKTKKIAGRPGGLAI